MDKPEKVAIGKCIVCHAEPRWNQDGYVETKGFHKVLRLDTGSGNAASNFGNNLWLKYPCDGSGDLVCTACIPALLERYIKAMGVWSI